MNNFVYLQLLFVQQIKIEFTASATQLFIKQEIFCIYFLPVATMSQVAKLRSAIRSGDLEVVKEIIDTRRDLIDKDMDVNGWRPLHVACFQGQLPIVSYLLESGRVDVNVVTKRNQMNGIHLSCLKGHHEIIRALIQHNANINKCAALKWTGLHLAAIKGKQGEPCAGIRFPGRATDIQAIGPFQDVALVQGGRRHVAQRI